MFFLVYLPGHGVAMLVNAFAGQRLTLRIISKISCDRSYTAPQRGQKRLQADLCRKRSGIGDQCTYIQVGIWPAQNGNGEVHVGVNTNCVNAKRRFHKVTPSLWLMYLLAGTDKNRTRIACESV